MTKEHYFKIPHFTLLLYGDRDLTDEQELMEEIVINKEFAFKALIEHRAYLVSRRGVHKQLIHWKYLNQYLDKGYKVLDIGLK